jgi:hypothetical protein
VRADALIPTIEPSSYFEEKPFEFVTFDAYLLHLSDVLKHKDMDGVTEISARLHQNGELEVNLDGAKKKVGLRLMPLPGAGGVERVTVNGKPLARRDSLTLVPSSEAGWTRGSDGILRAVIEQ